MARFSLEPGVTAALAATTLLGLAACSDPGAAAALVPESIKKDGKLTVAVSPFAAPLAVYATDNKTPVGNEVDIAVALAQTLGLEADIFPTALGRLAPRCGVREVRGRAVQPRWNRHRMLQASA